MVKKEVEKGSCLQDNRTTTVPEIGKYNKGNWKGKS